MDGNNGKRWPFIQWFVSDWLGDPKVSQCEPATRGILFDWLCNMHALDRSGVITGSPDLLARLGRCSAVQCREALEDLKRTKAADVTERNGMVTVVNRRMKREEMLRKSGQVRQQDHRKRKAVTPLSRDNLEPETQNQNQSPEPQSPEDKPALEGVRGDSQGGRAAGTRNGTLDPELPLDGRSKVRVAAEIMNNTGNWFYDNCRVSREMFCVPSLCRVLEDFNGRLRVGSVLQTFGRAVEVTHAHCVDFEARQRPVQNPGGWCVDQWRKLLQAASGPGQ